jgi:hypothetical protein
MLFLVIQEWHMEYGRAKQAILAASPVGGHRKNILIQNFFLELSNVPYLMSNAQICKEEPCVWYFFAQTSLSFGRNLVFFKKSFA